MEIFITAPQGKGKSTLAEAIALMHGAQAGRPTIERVSVAGNGSIGTIARSVKHADILIFDDLWAPHQLAKARSVNELLTPSLSIYVTQSDLAVELVRTGSAFI